jgi:O-antigen/teichoic acid export membrane protein
LTEDKQLSEKAKKTLVAINWVTVIAILSGVGLVLFIIWYWLKQRSKEKPKQ